MEKNQQKKETLAVLSLQTSSYDDVVLWFGDLWKKTGTANVVSAFPFIPFVLISWIGCDVLDIMCVHMSSAVCSYGAVHLRLIVKRLLASVHGKLITDVAVYQLSHMNLITCISFYLGPTSTWGRGSDSVFPLCLVCKPLLMLHNAWLHAEQSEERVSG